MKKRFNLIALIPARKGSERIKNKNIYNLNNKPLISYTIKSAIKSKIFDRVIVSTDSIKYAKISKKYGAEVPFLRPKKISKSNSPDYEWLKFTIDKLDKENYQFTHFFILRPTNPFRDEKTILRAWRQFKKNKKAESLRAIRICKEHPGKMWTVKGKFIKPIMNLTVLKQPSYNNQLKSLTNVYIQNASLEISKKNVVKKYKTISGKKIIPFFTNEIEGFDINYPSDIYEAKKIYKKIK